MRIEKSKIIDLCEKLEKDPFFINEAKSTTIKITLLNIPFIRTFGSGRKSFLNTFVCNGNEYRILFFNSRDKIIDDGVNQRLYVELIEGDTHNMDNWLLLADFLYTQCNPTGVYIIEKWLIERI